MENLEPQINHMPLDCRRKPEYPKKTHEDTGEFLFMLSKKLKFSLFRNDATLIICPLVD